MRTFAEKRKTTQANRSAKSPTFSRAHFGQGPDPNSISHLRRTIGNQAEQGLLHAGAEGFTADSQNTSSSRIGHDFSKVRIHAGEAQSKPATAVNSFYSAARIPLADSDQEDSVRQPPTVPGTPTPAPAPSRAEGCGTPRRMVAVKSGAFHGGLAMSHYYPYLARRGFWVSNTNAGPFDTGSRVGASIQLYGLVPSPCQPTQYRFEQTYQDTRLIRNGVHSPGEGRVIDDFARSGQDQSRPPFRQLFLDTAGGEGLAISMGDPPSETYGSSDNLEWDCSYVTSLVGPSGRVSHSWSTSVRVVSGTVTRNTLS